MDVSMEIIIIMIRILPHVITDSSVPSGQFGTPSHTLLFCTHIIELLSGLGQRIAPMEQSGGSREGGEGGEIIMTITM